MASPKANIIFKKHTQTLKRIFFFRLRDVSISVIIAIVSAKMWWLEPYMQLIPKKKGSVVKKQEEKKTY